MLALAAALVVSSWPGVLKTGDTLPPVALTDQDGARVRVDGFSGQNVLLSFVSTRRASPTFCPAVTAKFLYFQEHMPSVGYRLVQISRDAGADSPQRLQRYAALFGARSADWSFLTGKPGDIARLISSLDAGSAADGYEKLYVVNGRGRILGELPANDWSPADALVWASTIAGTAAPRSVTYVGHSSAAMARPYRAALSLEGQSLMRRLDLVEYDSSPDAP
ncbi:MAG TPA: SCO family protein, partial [Candidatus Eremiobacteraceae bacterium]|nr:SCO family protein [Candidatus Eremiobacteraceae bacterium]